MFRCFLFFSTVWVIVVARNSDTSYGSLSHSDAKTALGVADCYEHQAPAPCHAWVRMSKHECKSVRLPAGTACGSNDDNDVGNGICTSTGQCLDYGRRGPYSVGYRTEVLVDTSRYLNGTVNPGHASPTRPLFLRIWYPANPAQATGTPARYDFGNDVSTLPYPNVPSAPSNVSLYMDGVYANIDAVGGPWPVAFLSHGTGGEVQELMPFGPHLASWGYVVVGEEFTCNNGYGPSGGGAAGCTTAIPGLPSGVASELSGVRYDDAVFVLNTMQARAGTDATNLPFAHADASRTAVVGHSLGTAVALTLACGGPFLALQFPALTRIPVRDVRVRAIYLIDSFVSVYNPAVVAFNFSKCEGAVFHFGSGIGLGSFDNGIMQQIAASADASDVFYFDVPSLSHLMSPGDGCQRWRAYAPVMQYGTPTTQDRSRCSGRGVEIAGFCDSSPMTSGNTDPTVTFCWASNVAAYTPYFTQAMRGMPLTAEEQVDDVQVARHTFATAFLDRYVAPSSAAVQAAADAVLTTSYAAEHFAFGTMHVQDSAPRVANPVDFPTNSSVRFTRASSTLFGPPNQLQGGYSVQYFASSSLSGAPQLQTPFGTRSISTFTTCAGTTNRFNLTMTGGFPLPDGQLNGPTVGVIGVYAMGFLVAGPFQYNSNFVCPSAASVASWAGHSGNYRIMPYAAPLNQIVVDSTSGVWVNNLADRFVVTWVNVRNQADNSTTPNTFQCTLWADGTIEFFYASVSVASPTAYGIPYAAEVGVGNGRVRSGEGSDHVVDFSTFSSTPSTPLDIGAIHESFSTQYPYVLPVPVIASSDFAAADVSAHYDAVAASSASTVDDV
jgi:hypothetical protein